MDCDQGSHLHRSWRRDPDLRHQWGQWTVEQEADCFHDGKEIRTCATCGETESQIVPANDGNCPSKDFQDLDCTRWYHEGVDFALDQGLMIGMGDGRFLPNGELTRGQLMTILYRMAGEPETAETAPFADVKMDQYYGQAIAWAAENGIAKGITDTRFAPNAGCGQWHSHRHGRPLEPQGQRHPGPDCHHAPALF